MIVNQPHTERSMALVTIRTYIVPI